MKNAPPHIAILRRGVGGDGASFSYEVPRLLTSTVAPDGCGGPIYLYIYGFVYAQNKTDGVDEASTFQFIQF